MRKYLTRIIPFDIENAKRIMNGEMKGIIKDGLGRKARIVATDVVGGQPILALVSSCDSERELMLRYNADGTYFIDGCSHVKNLQIVVNTRFEDYSDFTPSLFQSCLAREGQCFVWKVCVFIGKTTDDKMMFLMSDNNEHEFSEFIPLSKDTYNLIDSCKSYEGYITEQIENGEK